MGKVGHTHEKVKTKKYQLSPLKVVTTPIVNRTYYNESVDISVEKPLNPHGQEQESRTVDLTRVHYEVIGFELVDPKKQSCLNFLTKTAVNSSSEQLFPCGDIWEHYQYFDEHGKPYKMQYGYTLDKPDVDEYVSFIAQQACQAEVDRLLEQLETDNPSEQIPRSEYDPKAERKRHLQKVKKTVRRLINANRLTYMYTLTFALELNANVQGLRFILPEQDQRDRERVFDAWNVRLTDLRRFLKKTYQRTFKFVLVPETHDSDNTDPRKKGTYHLHLATDKPLDKAELQDLWGYGVVWVDDFSQDKTWNKDTHRYETHKRDFLNDPGRYMAKYLEKEIDSPDEDFTTWKKHKYSSSRNLKRPEKLKIRDEHAIHKALQHPASVFDFEGVSKVQAAKVRALKDINEIKTFENSYEVEFQKWKGDKQTGEMETVKLKVHYACYNFRLLLPGAKTVLPKTGFVEKK